MDVDEVVAEDDDVCWCWCWLRKDPALPNRFIRLNAINAVITR